MLTIIETFAEPAIGLNHSLGNGREMVVSQSFGFQLHC